MYVDTDFIDTYAAWISINVVSYNENIICDRGIVPHFRSNPVIYLRIISARICTYS